MTTQLLLISADKAYALLLQETLAARGYVVDLQEQKDIIVEKIRSGNIDLCIIDLTQRKASMLALLAELRNINEQIPLLVLSPKMEKDLIVETYHFGGDECIEKPCATEVLVCKMESWLRRQRLEFEQRKTIYKVGSLTFDTIQKTLTSITHTQSLSDKETDILRLLVMREGQLVERRQILNRVWNTDSVFASRSLSVYINRLRTKLSVDKNIKLLCKIGKGYMLVIDNGK